MAGHRPSVTQRDGRGHWGGRVLRVRIEGSDGTVTPLGDEVRSKLRLQSDWFRVVPPNREESSIYTHVAFVYRTVYRL